MITRTIAVTSMTAKSTTYCHYFAQVHNRDAVAEAIGLFHIVSGQEDGHA